ncbi:rRNA maturation RNase YbeY [candidate division NPL-UPA2 bacterium]|nr:rRNA maturation RNase YbeY [candidate division NPL-UPA2 bacterium]
MNREEPMVKIKNEQRKIKVDQRIIRQAGEETLRRENSSLAEVSIVLVTDNYIKDLNRKYRGVEEATDVLAFPMQEGEFSGLHPHLLGDVVISVERAREQAREFGHRFEEELNLLTIHGLLHLLGYDDQTDKDRKKMEVREKEIWKAVVTT